MKDMREAHAKMVAARTAAQETRGSADYLAFKAAQDEFLAEAERVALDIPANPWPRCKTAFWDPEARAWCRVALQAVRDE